jgi:hypothetical protein
MKKLKFSFLFIPLLLFTFCCTHFPEREDMEKGDPPSCLDYQRCLYYSVKMKMALDCSRVYDRCSKDRTFQSCSGELPGDMKFQECWDKRQ